LNPAPALCSVETTIAQRYLDVVVDIEIRNEIEGLEDESDLLVAQARALVVVEAAHIDAIELVFPAAELLEESRDGEKRGLAGARGAGNRDELTLLDLDGEIAQRIGLDHFGAVRF
jgi:hypothetical protein